jgi:LacI family transcriptional regulator
MDMERFMGLKSEIPNAELMVIPMEQEARTIFYMEHLGEIKKYSAVFAVSDYYAMDFIQFLKNAGVSVPEDISVVGFDNVRECEKFEPALTTIKQDYRQRAALAVKMLNRLRNGDSSEKNVLLPVTLIERDSVCEVKMHKE